MRCSTQPEVVHFEMEFTKEMNLLILIQAGVILFLLWLLKHLVRFYKGVLREREQKTSLLTFMKVAIPLAILGIGSQIILVFVLMMKTVGLIS